MQKVHLDTDIGGEMDDLCALAMLLKWPDLTITGITTVADVQGRRNGYVRRVLSLAGRDEIPSASGADVESNWFRFRPGYPDEHTYWGSLIPPSPNPIDAALNLLKASIDAGATIICIGPFTNLHLLDLQHPGILESAHIVLMGGFTYPVHKDLPPWDNMMDYNVQLDVRSARYVIEHSDPLLVPLGITVQTALRRAYLQQLRSTNEVNRLIVAQAEAFAVEWHNEATYGATCSRLPSNIINFQHDPLTCAIALNWSQGVVVERLPIAIQDINGWLHESIQPNGKPTRVVTQINGERFNQFWFDLLTTSQ